VVCQHITNDYWYGRLEKMAEMLVLGQRISEKEDR
jgi:hypothetical protein